MKFELIGRTTAKLTNVNVQALKLGQTELQPAVTLRFKVTAANTILNQLDPSLRTFLFEKNGAAAKTEQTLDGVEPVSDLAQLTPAAEKLGDFDWSDEQTGCTLIVYQGVTGDADIKLKDGTVDKLKICAHEGGAVDVFFNFYVADLDAETMGELAVLHQHEVDIELTAPEAITQQQTLTEGDDDADEQPSGPANPLQAMLDGKTVDGTEAPPDAPAGSEAGPGQAWPFPTTAHDQNKDVPVTTKRRRKVAAEA